MFRYETLKPAFVSRDYSASESEIESENRSTSRQLLEVAADSIIAVLFEPDDLGLTEVQAIAMAGDILDEALSILVEVSPRTFKVRRSRSNDATRAQLNQAACVLKSIADQL